MSLPPEDIAAVARVMELISKCPPYEEHWDHAQRHGPHLSERLKSWLKENI